MNRACTGRKFPSTYITTSGDPSFFVVGGLVQSSSGINWAIVRQCTVLRPATLGQLPENADSMLIEISTKPIYDMQDNHFQYLQLTDDVRKVGYLHNCTHQNDCVFSFEKQQVNHSSTTLSGSRFFLISKYMGYPPRRS